MGRQGLAQYGIKPGFPLARECAVPFWQTSVANQHRASQGESLFKVEDILLIFTPLHVLFEILLPDGGPGTTVEILYLVFDHAARSGRDAAAFSRKNQLVAIAEIVRLHLVESTHTWKKGDCAYRLH